MSPELESNSAKSPQIVNQTEALRSSLEKHFLQDDARRLRLGVITTAAAAVTAWAVDRTDSLDSSWHLSYSLPFAAAAQHIVTGVEDALVPVGEVALPTALAAIGIVKIMSGKDNICRFIDRFSSQEPSRDGKKSRFNRLKRGTGIAMTAAALGTFTAAISTEVTHGPERPIDAIGRLAGAPGSTIITEFEGAMPMVESNINTKLAAKIQSIARQNKIAATPIDLNLGAYKWGKHSGNTLIMGIDTPPTSPLHWQAEKGCQNIPIALDEAAAVPKEARVNINGSTLQVVDILHDTSAMNRIGGVIERSAMGACLRQLPEQAPPAMIIVNANKEKTQQIVNQANQEFGAPVAVTSKTDYSNASLEFWRANVQPITSILSLAAGGAALMAMSSDVAMRIVRNRSELAVKLAGGASANVLRLAEVLRSLKSGVVASVGGVLVGCIAAIGANAVVPGFRAGVGFRESMIGTGLCLLGTTFGSLISLTGLKRIANPKDNTRV